MMMTLPSRLAAALAAVALCACSSSSSSSKKDSSGSGQKYAERSRKSNWTDKHRSSFEKQAKTAEKTKTIKEGSFHTNDYHTKMASSAVSKEYKGKEFAQSDKQDKTMEKSFSGAHTTSRMGSESFKTSESHLGDQKNHDTGKVYNGGSQVFRTKDDVEAANAREKNKTPKIIDNGKPSYTEGEVRSLLNKG